MCHKYHEIAKELYTRTHTFLHRPRNAYIHTHTYTYVDIFFSIRSSFFFFYLMYSSKKRKKDEDEFSVSSSSSFSSFVHLNCCSCFYPYRHDVYRYAILCRCRLVLFLRFFLRMFFFDSIDDRNIECFMLSLFSRSSYSLLQSTLVAYSYVFLILHLRVLFRCVPYVYFVLKRKKNASQNELFQHVCHTLR